MSVAEKITRCVQTLPENAQAEVLDFVEFLAHKSTQGSLDQENNQWANGSVALAMARINQENEPDYSTDDTKEHF